MLVDDQVEVYLGMKAPIIACLCLVCFMHFYFCICLYVQYILLKSLEARKAWLKRSECISLSVSTPWNLPMNGRRRNLKKGKLDKADCYVSASRDPP